MKLIVGLGNPGAEFAGTRHNLGFAVIDKIISGKAASPEITKLQNGNVALHPHPSDSASMLKHSLHLSGNSVQVSGSFNKNLHGIVYKLPGIVLLKPQTFMNLSGIAAIAAVNFYKIDLENLLVIHDDVDFELGEVKHQFDKSSAGNNGVESIIKSLDSQAFHRLRLGIGHSQNPQMQTADHVLDKFSKEEKEIAEKMVDRAAEVALNWVESSAD